MKPNLRMSFFRHVLEWDRLLRILFKLTNANFLAVSKENFLIDQIFSILVSLVSSLFAQIVHFYLVLIIFLVLLSMHTMANNIYLQFHQVQFLFLLHLPAIYQPWNFKFSPPVCLSLKDEEVRVKDTPHPRHFIFEINVGKSRIRHATIWN